MGRVTGALTSWPEQRRSYLQPSITVRFVIRGRERQHRLIRKQGHGLQLRRRQQQQRPSDAAGQENAEKHKFTSSTSLHPQDERGESAGQREEKGKAEGGRADEKRSRRRSSMRNEATADNGAPVFHFS